MSPSLSRRSFTLPPLANGFEVEFSFVKDDVGDLGVVGVELTALYNSQKLLLGADPRRFITLPVVKGGEVVAGSEGARGRGESDAEDDDDGVLISAIKVRVVFGPAGAIRA